MLVLRLCLILTLCSLPVQAELQWKSLGAAPWKARFEHGSAIDRAGRIVIAGGAFLPLGPYLNDSWAFENGKWTQLPDSTWDERADIGLAALPNGTVVLVGGQREDGAYASKNDVHVLHKGAASWEDKGPAPWDARIGHTLTACPDGSLILVGGSSSRTNVFYKLFADVWRMSLDGKWSQITEKAPWAARFDHRTVCLSDGSLVMAGGGERLQNFNDMWRMTKDGAWTQIQKKCPWRARTDFMMAAGSDDTIVLAGEFSDTWKLEGVLQGKLQWTRQQDMPFPKAQRWKTDLLALPNNRFVVAGGEQTTSNDAFNDLWELSEGADAMVV